VTTWSEPRFTYRVNQPGVHFMCRIQGPHRAGTWRPCPVDSRGATSVSGSIKFTDLLPSRHGYAFTVYAYFPPSSDGTTPRVRGDGVQYKWYQFTPYAPHHYAPRTGASFNLPWGSTSQRRANLDRVTRMVDSIPGYKEAYPGLCPGEPGLVPGRIRVTLYSLTDSTVAKALVAARKRCVSVQVLMNNHLNRLNDPAWRALENGLGTLRVRNGSPQLSFAHRCSFGCDGSGVLHAKMYLFNSSIRPYKFDTVTNTVLVGSSNMTSNAAKVQWNDLYGVRNAPGLYGVYQQHFVSMARDATYHRSVGPETTGRYQTTFFPAPKGTDPELSALRSVRCTGASGAGIGGRSLVYINMHAWFGTRGTTFANQVRSLYNQGCYVRVLYSFMSFSVYKKLISGTGSRMSVRRTIFSHNGRTAYLYSHFKNIAVSGYVGGDRSGHVAWTGSNNFTDDGTHFDEVLMRIADHAAYNAYVNHFKYISSHKSSSVYANYSEPSGGGRAP
jgi:PLD-like domain